MRVLFDDEIFFRQRFGGVSRIFAMLLAELTNKKNMQVNFNCAYSENEYLLQLFPNTNSFFRNYNFPLKGKLIRGIYGSYSHNKTNRLLKQKVMDVFHPTFYADYYLPHLQNTPLVFTVHDLIHEKTSGNKHYADMAAIKAKNIARANQIIVVSNHTKKDLLELYPFVDEKIVNVIYLAQSLPKQSNIPRNLPENYILFTGERGGYKNFKTLLIAFAEIALQHPKLMLYCAGSSAFNSDELRLANELKVADKILHSKLTDEELRYAYEHALMFVYPSTYEGFGIPLLEAFEAGTPVIANNATSLPEVAGDAALLVDATSTDALTTSIKNIIENNELRESLIKKGKARAAEFSWEKHVAQTLAVYHKAKDESFISR